MMRAIGVLATVESEVGGKGQKLTLEMGEEEGSDLGKAWIGEGLGGNSIQTLWGWISPSDPKPLGREDGIWEEALARGRNGRRMGCE